jgi:hypothetical protein
MRGVSTRQGRQAASYPERDRTKVVCGNLQTHCQTFGVYEKQKKLIAKSTATLTQSGLLAALLQHQHRKVIELTQRHAQREQAPRLLPSTLTWLLARSHFIILGRRIRQTSGQGILPRHT